MNPTLNQVVSKSILPSVQKQRVPLPTFFHVSKTGGETLVTLLGIPKDHGTARSRLAAHPDLRNTWKISIVRNPWDRLVSWYFHLRRHLTPLADMRAHVTDLGKKAPCYVAAQRRLKMNPVEHRILAERLPFRRWALAVLNQPCLYTDPHWGPCGSQYDMIHDEHGTLLVDDVYKFEDGYSDKILPSILTRVGRSDLIPRIQVTNNSGPSRPHYSYYYQKDADLVREVGRYFRKDVDTFEYVFEDVDAS